MSGRFYISTPIYYVNERPHIGHVYTTTIADTVARTHRIDGDDVFFLTGTDEHASKVVEAAAERGLETREWADRNAAAFRDAFAAFGIENDDFIRTSEPRHIRFVEEVIAALEATGDVYLGQYEGWYDASQEEYVPEARAKEHDFCSPVTAKPLVRRTENNYFFKLSGYADAMLTHLETHPGFVQPAARRNEVEARIREGLDDVPISRTGGGDWGVKFPGNPEHLIYVWIDALLNYSSAVATDERRHYWPADVHLIAKDILWFHAVIWPAMLMALRKTEPFSWLELPGMVYSHSFWISEGQKMSKSLGNFVDLDQLERYRERFGLDALRFFLVTQGPLGTNDSDFAESRFIEVYNNDLANTVGNAVSRVSNMTGRYLDGRFAAVALTGDLRDQVEALEIEAGPLGLGRVAKGLELVRRVDGFVETTQPFRLAKEAGREDEVAAILYQCAETLRIASLHLWPALPVQMEELWRRMGLSYAAEIAAGRGAFAAWSAWGGLPTGAGLDKGPALFPRYQDEG